MYRLERNENIVQRGANNSRYEYWVIQECVNTNTNDKYDKGISYLSVDRFKEYPKLKESAEYSAFTGKVDTQEEALALLNNLRKVKVEEVNMEEKVKEIIKGTEYRGYNINPHSVEVYGSEFRLHISHDMIEKIKCGVETWSLSRQDIKIINALLMHIEDYKGE